MLKTVKFYFLRVRYLNSYNATIKTVSLNPSEAIIPALKADYDAMSNMFYGKAPAFDDILIYLKQLESEIHALS